MSKNQAIQKLLHKSGLCIRKYSPVALSCVASAGVVVTAIAAAKATPRAVALVYADSRKKHDGDPYAYTKKEAFIAAWRCYIPAVAFGVSTIACIMGANALNRRQQAALTSAYALVQSSYKEYKDKLKELYGEEAHNAIMDSIIKEKCKEVYISTPSFIGNSSLDFGEGKKHFYISHNSPCKFRAGEKRRERVVYTNSPLLEPVYFLVGLNRLNKPLNVWEVKVPSCSNLKPRLIQTP